MGYRVLRRRLVLSASCVFFGGMLPLAASAQSPGPTANPAKDCTDVKNAADCKAPAAATEQIHVTGSRIKRSNLESTSPIVTITGADIQAKGLVNTADILNQLPEIGAPGNSNVTNNFTDDSAGIQTVNLRNLGDARTLVLIDGRRAVGGVPPGQGPNAVDISVIPAYLIDSVDIVTGAGSATYGSEAVAGVVNFKLKNHYDGILFNQQFGETQYGDAKNSTTNFLAGTSFLNGDGHALVALQYTNTGSVLSRNRDISKFDTFLGTYRPSSYSLNGTFDTNNGRFVTLPNGSVAPYSGDAYGFNRDALRTILIPTDQLDLVGKTDYDILPGLNVYADARFARTTATSLLEPIAIGNTTTIGYAGNTLVLPISNPFVPAALRAQGGILDDGNGNFATFRKRFAELGDRGQDSTRDNYSVTGGVKWNVDPGLTGYGVGPFEVNAYGTYGETTDKGVSTNSGNVVHLQNALNATVINGAIVCSDPIARAQGCVPINIFGANNASAAALNYIKVTRTYNDKISEADFNADIGGPIFTLPYGPVRLDLGVEHRIEQGSNIPDALTQAGNTLDTYQPATSGGYNVTDFFAEGLVPILKDLPFAKELALDARYRRSRYSLAGVGGQDSYSYGGTYAPIPDIKLRIENAVAIRAPNISELYQGRSQSAVSITDPCSDQGLASAPNPGLRAANCSKIPGITPGFTEQNFNLQSETEYLSGNTNLAAERARVLTYGFVLQPRFIPRSSISVDAFKYFIANAIINSDPQVAANQCIDTGNTAYCSQIVRYTSGPAIGLIKSFDSFSNNAGAIREQGVDVAFNYSLPVASITNSDSAAVDFNWNYEHIQYLNNIDGLGNVVYQEGLFGVPKNRWTLDMLYHDAKLQLNYQLRYIGEQQYNQGVGVYVGSTTYSDVSIRYQVTPMVAPYIGVTNLFNNPPPLVDQAYGVGGGTAASVTGTETVANVYDAIGRSIYAGVRITLH